MLLAGFLRIFSLAFPTGPILLSALIVAGIITFVVLSKSQKVQQRAFVRKFNKVKAKQKAYKEEKDQNKLESRVKAYNKAIKKMRKRISYALWWNKKNIILTKPCLFDESEHSNLAISGTPFTFKDVLDEMANKKYENKKKRVSIKAETKAVKQLEKSPVVAKLNEPEKKIEPIKTISQTAENKNLKNIYSNNAEIEKTH